MKAIRMHETGGPEVVRLEEVERPRPGPRDALVEIRAASLNHLDLWVRTGQPKPPLPHTLGSDGAGVVVELGADAAAGLAGERPSVGDEVVIDPGVSCGACEACLAGEQSQCPSFHLVGEGEPGTLAEYAVVPARNCHPRPSRLSWAEAAAFGLVHLTAWRMLMTRARLGEGESVLIHGIGGGVATAALGIARMKGARSIVVTSGSDAKLARAKELGATGTVNYRGVAAKELPRAIRAANGDRPIDVVVDTVGGETWGTSLRALRKGGRLVTCGATAGGNPPADLQRIFWSQLTILGSTMGTPREMRDALAAAEAGLLRPVVDSTYPLEHAKDAMARLEAKEQFGKVVVSVRPS